MHSFVPFAALLSVVQAFSISGLLGRSSQDSCGAVNAPLKLTLQQPLRTIVIGNLSTSFIRYLVLGWEV